MRVLGNLFILLNLFASLILSADRTALPLDADLETGPDFTQTDLSIQQGSFNDLGEALPSSFLPERPLVRTSFHFFEAESLQTIVIVLSEYCQSGFNSYQKTALTIEPGLPSFLIAFPHHYFT